MSPRPEGFRGDSSRRIASSSCAQPVGIGGMLKNRECRSGDGYGSDPSRFSVLPSARDIQTVFSSSASSAMKAGPPLTPLTGIPTRWRRLVAVQAAKCALTRQRAAASRGDTFPARLGRCRHLHAKVPIVEIPSPAPVREPISGTHRSRGCLGLSSSRIPATA
jgi:hypothetical protein